MERNEIKSFTVDVPLDKLNSMGDYIKTKSGYIGILSIYKPVETIECIKVQRGITSDTRLKCILLGYIPRDSNKEKQKVVIQFLDSYNITQCNIEDVYVVKEVVLKEQIKNLKYVEQLELFKDGEESNG